MTNAVLSRRSIFLIIGIFLSLIAYNIVHLNTEGAVSILYAQWLPSISGSSEQRVGRHVWRKSREPGSSTPAQDEHPIQGLMREADWQFKIANADRGQTFRETVEKYRRRYGRHPPPRFKEVRRELRRCSQDGDLG